MKCSYDILSHFDTTQHATDGQTDRCFWYKAESHCALAVLCWCVTDRQTDRQKESLTYDSAVSQLRDLQSKLVMCVFVVDGSISMFDIATSTNKANTHWISISWDTCYFIPWPLITAAIHIKVFLSSIHCIALCNSEFYVILLLYDFM